MDMNASALRFARTLWRYNNVSTPAAPADALIVMGTNDLGIPRHAAKIFHQFRYRWVVVTGGVYHSRSIRGEEFNGTEAEVFYRLLAAERCPTDVIFLENDAENTGQNITFSRDLFDRHNIAISSCQLVHSPTMQRRALATACKQWPVVSWQCSCESISFEQYIHGLDLSKFLKSLVGDTYRILAYADKGYQMPNHMPDDVQVALRELIRLGFTGGLPSDHQNDCLIHSFLRLPGGDVA